MLDTSTAINIIIIYLNCGKTKYTQDYSSLMQTILVIQLCYSLSIFQNFSQNALTQATLSSEFQKLSSCQVNLPLYQLGPALLYLDSKYNGHPGISCSMNFIL